MAYLDNILVYTKGTLQEHIKHNKKVIKALQDKGLKLKVSKYKFHKKEVEFIGLIITIKEIRIDLKKV